MPHSHGERNEDHFSTHVSWKGLLHPRLKTLQADTCPYIFQADGGICGEAVRKWAFKGSRSRRIPGLIKAIPGNGLCFGLLGLLLLALFLQGLFRLLLNILPGILSLSHGLLLSCGS